VKSGRERREEGASAEAPLRARLLAAFLRRLGTPSLSDISLGYTFGLS